MATITPRLLSESVAFSALQFTTQQALVTIQEVVPPGSVSMDALRKALDARGDLKTLIDNIPAAQNADGTLNKVNQIWTLGSSSSPSDALAGFLQTAASGLQYGANAVISLYQAAGINNNVPIEPDIQPANFIAWGMSLVDVNGGEPPTGPAWYLDSGILKFNAGS